MKRRMVSVFALLALCLLLITPVFAETERLPRLLDLQGVFSDGEYAALLDRLDEVSARYGFEVLIVTDNTLEGGTATSYADDLFDYAYDLTGEDGILLLLYFSDEGNQYAYSTSGSGLTIFDDRAMDELDDAFLPALRAHEYYDACNDFIDACDEILAGPGFFSLGTLVFALIVGIIIAFIVVGIWKGKLKTVRAQAAATSYLRPGSMVLTQNRDLYLYRNVTRTARPKPSSGSNSSTHTSSSGSSHGGRSGGF